jgi:twitching motility protein PilT
MLNTIEEKLLYDIDPLLQDTDRQAYVAQQMAKLTYRELSFLKTKLREYFLTMRRLDASDIEIGGSTCQDGIWLRIQGVKKLRQEFGTWTPDQSDILLQSIINDTQKERLLKNRAVDFSYFIEHEGKTLRWRATLYFDLGHLALNMRTIASDIYPYNQLGFHQNISRSFSLQHEKQGLILFTGITGSGKSTSMDSILDANNRTTNGHIVIIGDPIEYIHKSNKCLVRHREVGTDVLSFKDGAIQSLRQDPDIIVVGEMRDPETIMTCLEISDTGHKVFSTLHTGSAVETIDRIVAECPTQEQQRVRIRLADQLRVIVSQKLIPNKSGRLQLAKEIMLVTSAIKAAIRNENTHEIYQMISENGKQGMITLEQDLTRLCKQGIITQDTAIDYANNKNRIKELLS